MIEKIREFRTGNLLQTRAISLASDEFLKYREDLFAVVIHTFQVVVKAGFESLRIQPLFEKRSGDIDIFAQCLDGVSAKEQTIKHCGLPLRSKRVEVISELRVPHRAPRKKAV